MADLFVSWNDYHHAIEKLAAKVHASGFKFNQIICLARGGLRVGDVLSRIFNQPLGVLATQSYFANADKTAETQGELTIGQHLAKVNERLGERVLLVDDLVDSGKTMEEVIRHLQLRYPGIKHVKSAVLWKKGCSVFTPDFWAEDLPHNPWIHQPMELYDKMDPKDLAARVGAI
ncbi:MAG: phosphoribosyltransferase [Burkholderiales bacterium]